MPEPIASTYVEIKYDQVTKAQQAIDKMGAGFNKAASDIDSRTQKMSRAFGALGGVIAGIGIAKFGSDIFQASLKMENLNKMLLANEGSQKKANDAMAKYLQMAKSPGLNLTQITQGMTQLKSLGVSATQAEKTIMALGNQMVLSGRGAEEFGRVMVQIQQSIGKGRLMAEDLRVVAESMPMVRKLMTDAFGTADTDKLAKMGISAIDFWTKLTTQMEKSPKAIGGTQNAIDNFHDSLLQFEAALGKVVMPSVGRFLDGLTKLMDQFNAMPEATKNVIGGATVGLLGIAGAVTAIKTAMDLLALSSGIKALGGIAGATAGSGIASVAQRAYVHDPTATGGMAGTWVTKEATSGVAKGESAFLKGSAMLQIATATIAIGSVIWAGSEIYKAVKRDFTAEEKANIADAPNKAWNLGMSRLTEAQMGKGNFPKMTVGELGTEDFINGLLESMGLPSSARNLSLQGLKGKYGFQHPVYDKEFGPLESEKTTKSIVPELTAEDKAKLAEEAKKASEIYWTNWFDHAEAIAKQEYQIKGGAMPSMAIPGLNPQPTGAHIQSYGEYTPSMPGGVPAISGLDISRAGLTSGLGLGTEVSKTSQEQVKHIENVWKIEKKIKDDFFAEWQKDFNDTAKDMVGFDNQWNDFVDDMGYGIEDIGDSWGTVIARTKDDIFSLYETIKPLLEKLGLSANASDKISSGIDIFSRLSAAVGIGKNLKGDIGNIAGKLGIGGKGAEMAGGIAEGGTTGSSAGGAGLASALPAVGQAVGMAVWGEKVIEAGYDYWKQKQEFEQLQKTPEGINTITNAQKDMFQRKFGIGKYEQKGEPATKAHIRGYEDAMAQLGLEPYPLAKGGSFIVTKPTLFMAGEAGRERVEVIPNAKLNLSGSSGNGGNTHIEIHNINVPNTWDRQTAENVIVTAITDARRHNRI